MPIAQIDVAGGNSPGSSPNGGEQRLAFCVAGTCFELFSDCGVAMTLDPGLRGFAVEPKSSDVRIQVDWTDDLEVPSDAPRFQSGGLWSLYEESSGYRFYFSSPSLGAKPYKAAWFDPGFSRGQVAMFRPYFDPSRPIYPLEYPLDELLMIHRLACGEGVEVHAVGVVDEAQRGHLFLGHSGAGKSTTARLWQSQPLAHILSDDRIILRASGGQIRMHGTPWHGDAGVASCASAPLHRIYLLEHSHKTELCAISPGRAAAELFARSFVPHHSSEGLQFTLQFLDRVAREVPCSVFRFVPDISAVEAIHRAGE
ncbi:MAG TPA: hypothetical protein VJO53_13560 [Candidatus Acidoferrales bacterium]|nr:hypothetical protein [Candidatus Acidoferrales bacterium]